MRVLNVGCGESDYGTDFVDLYPLKKGIKKCDVDKELLPYEDNTFDEVYSFMIFEHLTSPYFALSEMHRVLKKGGKIEIHTNNAGYLWFHNSRSKIKTHYGGYEGLHRHSGEEDKHYGLYTFHHMENHLSKIGFEHVRADLYCKSTKGVRLLIRGTNYLLSKSPFKWMAYPTIKATGVKRW